MSSALLRNNVMRNLLIGLVLSLVVAGALAGGTCYQHVSQLNVAMQQAINATFAGYISCTSPSPTCMNSYNTVSASFSNLSQQASAAILACQGTTSVYCMSSLLSVADPSLLLPSSLQQDCENRDNTNCLADLAAVGSRLGKLLARFLDYTKQC